MTSIIEEYKITYTYHMQYLQDQINETTAVLKLDYCAEANDLLDLNKRCLVRMIEQKNNYESLNQQLLINPTDINNQQSMKKFIENFHRNFQSGD